MAILVVKKEIFQAPFQVLIEEGQGHYESYEAGSSKCENKLRDIDEVLNLYTDAADRGSQSSLISLISRANFTFISSSKL